MLILYLWTYKNQFIKNVWIRIHCHYCHWGWITLCNNIRFFMNDINNKILNHLCIQYVVYVIFGLSEWPHPSRSMAYTVWFLPSDFIILSHSHNEQEDFKSWISKIGEPSPEIVYDILPISIYMYCVFLYGKVFNNRRWKNHLINDMCRWNNSCRCSYGKSCFFPFIHITFSILYRIICFIYHNINNIIVYMY